jgi:hypothetical protein
VPSSLLQQQRQVVTGWGQGKVLDAAGGGWIFTSPREEGITIWGASPFLELHDAVLQNGLAERVSEWVLVPMLFSNCSLFWAACNF